MATDRADDAMDRLHGSFNRGHIASELEEKGYCVVPGVVPEEECDARMAAYHAWLAQFSGDDFPFERHSIIQSYRIGHFQTTWETRLSAMKVFQAFWQTEKLLTSFDGVALSPPPATDNGYARPGDQWLHLDQSVRRRGLHGVQGAVYLEDAGRDDYCFRVLEGSHRHTDSFWDEFPDAAQSTRTIDFFMFKEKHRSWYTDTHKCPLVKVPVPKGGMVLWDSRTVHDNSRPEREREHRERWRGVVFVCMAPARWAAPGDMAEKRKAYKQMRMTSHWPAQGVRMFPHRDHQDAVHGITEMSKLPEAARRKESRLLAADLQYDFDDGCPNGPDWDPQWHQL